MEKPNILFIVTDQQLFNTLGCVGHPLVETPHLDALAQEGLLFSNAYTPSPLCGPARASLFTGVYPSGHKVFANHLCPDPGLQYLTDYLFQSGYYSGLVGKLHVSPPGARNGFDWRRLCDSPHGVYSWDEVKHNDYLRYLERSCHAEDPARAEHLAGMSERQNPNDPGFWMGWSWVDDEHHYHTWCGNEARNFLSKVSADKPFYLNVSFFGPHHPYTSCEPWDSMYNPDSVILPPTFHRQKESPVFVETAVTRRESMSGWEESWWRMAMARYYGQISQIDREVGRILQALRERGAWDNTLIVFTSDHGDHMGNFGLLGKGDMYEGSVRVPLIIKGPGQRSLGKRIENPVTILDLFATFLDYAGNAAFEHDPWIESRSLANLIRSNGQIGLPREEIYSTHILSGGISCSMVRIGDWKLIRLDRVSGEPLYEMYDLREYPLEMTDRFGDATCAMQRRKLQNALDGWCTDQGRLDAGSLRAAYSNGTGFSN